MVFVISKDAEILMSTKRYRKVRWWLSKEQAKVISSAPFTIQLLFDTTGETQFITSIQKNRKGFAPLLMHRLKPRGSILKSKVRCGNSALRLKTDGVSCHKGYK